MANQNFGIPREI